MYSNSVASIMSKNISNSLANLKTWESIVFNVKNYGARGDGITNDLSDIMKAIIAASVTGGIVLFPPGVYVINSYLTIPSNIAFQGSGKGISVIRFMNGSDPTGGPNYGGGPKIISNDKPLISPYNHNISIKDLTFDGNGNNQTNGLNISFKSVTNLCIERCQFLNFGNDGVYNQGLVIFESNVVRVIDCDFTNNSGDGLAVAETCVDVFVNGCTADGNGDYGFVVSNVCSNVVLATNTSKNNDQHGIGVDECSGVVLQSNICHNNGQFGIVIQRFAPNLSFPNGNYILTGNICYGNTCGFTVQSAEWTVLNGNHAYANGDGCQIIDGKDCQFVGNTIINNTSHGVLLISYDDSIGTENNTLMQNTIAGNFYGIRELNSGGTINANIMWGNNLYSNTADYTLLVSKVRAVNFGDTVDKINGYVDYDAALSANSATAGIASDLPATPSGYLTQRVNGVNVKIPYFNV